MMKKKHLEKTLNALKSNLAKNAVTPEAQNLIDEITAILAELANDPDVEYNEADVMAKVTALAEKAGAEAAAEVASSFEKKFKTKNELDVKLARELFGQALLNSAGRGKGVFKKEFESLLSQNKITGLPTLTEVFPEIQTKFEKTSILSKLRKLGTQNLNIPVSLQEDDSTNVRAQGHTAYNSAGADVAKVDQILAINPKNLTLGAIYKRIRVPKLMSYQTGNVGQLMSWLANELIERIDNELQRVILVGDGRAAGATNKITSFETIGTKTQADAYTVYAEKANALPTLADVRALVDQMDSSKPITMYAHPAVITNLQSFQYAAGGAVSYITDEVLANQLGVAEIVRTKMLVGAVPAAGEAAAKYPLIVFIQHDSYGYIGSDLFSVDYEKWDYNQDVLMAEIFAGGGVIKPNASGVLKVTVPAASGS